MKKILKDSILCSSIFLNVLYSVMLILAWIKNIDIKNFGVTIVIILNFICSIISFVNILTRKEK